MAFPIYGCGAAGGQTVGPLWTSHALDRPCKIPKTVIGSCMGSLPHWRKEYLLRDAWNRSTPVLNLGLAEQYFHSDRLRLGQCL